MRPGFPSESFSWSSSTFFNTSDKKTQDANGHLSPCQVGYKLPWLRLNTQHEAAGLSEKKYTRCGLSCGCNQQWRGGSRPVMLLSGLLSWAMWDYKLISQAANWPHLALWCKCECAHSEHRLSGLGEHIAPIHFTVNVLNFLFPPGWKRSRLPPWIRCARRSAFTISTG